MYNLFIDVELDRWHCLIVFNNPIYSFIKHTKQKDIKTDKVTCFKKLTDPGNYHKSVGASAARPSIGLVIIKVEHWERRPSDFDGMRISGRSSCCWVPPLFSLLWIVDWKFEMKREKKMRCRYLRARAFIHVFCHKPLPINSVHSRMSQKLDNIHIETIIIISIMSGSKGSDDPFSPAFSILSI